MILPSEDDSRKPGESGPPDNPGDGLESSEASGDFDDDTDDEHAGETGHVQSPAPPGWRAELQAAVLEAIDELKEIEDPEEEFDPPEPPDLFTFYSELVAMRNELRRGARLSPEALRQLAAGNEKLAGTGGPQRLAMALVYLHDRLSGDRKMLTVVESAMFQANIQRVRTKDAVFDPETMVCDDTIGAGAKVKRELEAGFLWNGNVLRPARVEVS